MSRIDKALQDWENSTVDVPTTTSKPSEAQTRAGTGTAAGAERFNLSAYQREEPSAAEQPFPRQEAAPPAVEAPTPETPKPANTRPRASRRTRTSPDIEARLVTGGTSGVPLEQYRRLAAVLHDIQLQQGLKTLMITSSLPSEGKTLTIVNLALTLSESYARRVLVIDADLRWPSIHTMMGLPNGAGLSEALKGQQFDLPLHQVTERLAVLTAGRPGPAPLAGLTSARMGAIIEECAAHFDWVLIDTPPVGLLPDAQLLARLTRAVVFVIAAGSTPAATVERAVAELGPDCIIGTVLNRVDARRIPQAEYYDYYGKDDRPEP